VHFVTFNYDVSLEKHLLRSLVANDLFDGTDIEKFVSDQRVVHVYGSVGPQLPREGDVIQRGVAQGLSEPSFRRVTKESSNLASVF
jgi:hypothetical protein